MHPSHTPPLLPHIQRLNDRMARVLDDADATLPNFDGAQWNWSPNQTWSAALVCDHLNRVGELILPHLENAVAQTRAAGHLSATPTHCSTMERLFLRLVSPDPPFKLPVPPLYVPKPIDHPQGAGQRFLELHRRGLSGLRDSNGLDMSRVIISSPASRFIRLSAGAWFEAMVGHTEYHWLQVKVLCAHPQFPGQK